MSRNKLRKKWDRLGREEIRLRQANRLHRYLRDCVIPYSAHYRELFEREGLDPGSFRSLDDLQRIPFTNKVDLLDAMEHPDGLKRFALLPDEETLARRPAIMARALLYGRKRVKKALAHEYRPIFLTSTTGRSSKPVSFLYSHHDLDNLASAGERLVSVLGAVADDRILNMFPFAPHLAFWQTHYATKYAGVFCIGTGGGKVMGTSGNIRLLEKVQPQALIGMPTFIYHVLHQAVEEGRRCSSLRSLVLGGEKVPPGMRRKLARLAEALGGRNLSVVATYGLTEARMAFGECPFPIDGPSPGYHLYPDLGLFEVIHPETGDVVPDGTPGELVYTPIDWRGSVVLRYRTNDYLEGGMVYEPCPCCGRSLPRLVGNISRKSQTREMRVEKIKGTMVDFNELEVMLDDIDFLGAWMIELRKVNDDAMELDELILHVHALGDIKRKDLVEQLNKQFQACTELRPNEIHFHSAEAMRHLQGVGKELKEKRIADHRPSEDQEAPRRIRGEHVVSRNAERYENRADT